MKALVLAAGYAKRLYPLTRNYPKALLQIGTKPIINYLIEKLERIEDIGEIIVITNGKFYLRFKKWAADLKYCSKPLSVLSDGTRSLNDRLGAIGDIGFAIRRRRIKGDLLILGADNLFNEELYQFLSFCKTKSSYPVMGVYDIADKRKVRQYGIVKLNKNSRIVYFEEKPAKSDSTLVAMCLYYFPRAKIHLINEYLNKNKHSCDAIGFYIRWLHKKDRVYGFVFRGRWYDIGDPKIYQKVREFYG
jgi:glucose-1-phosphate thymidylyltransferase